MHKQKGMTFIGMIFTVVVIVMAAIVVMRVIPVYLQYYSIIKSVKGLNTVPVSTLSGDPMADVNLLKSTMDKRLDINGVESLKDNQLMIEPIGSNKFRVKVKYQVIKPLVYNISLLFDFDHTEEVVAGSES
ncbi:DUF4845 domain-containing protein [Fluoribacter gormanii]|uniref:DUF4845 domain-containing protein n=1 Tax=Fluoribacter gormanii TaxID=464 RepID=A0A377GJT1_9GAMM|nr:DUF4845 domain-containing protein [Fluoribacter gormanii]KTD04254.1 transmembrane protein [Fluoribacter gormanii]MCW8443383.1 DUF4845 domain-containing protein [Fluoribacter gormanii]MCW8471808.1 DUF4845 domain-containing protein [Fluoribacter gormanii]SIR75118.1 protein of unknown function [Fluoribacter gormanii]STO25079.1 Uncharacterised protein [Fluoribacter gormanii]